MDQDRRGGSYWYYGRVQPLLQKVMEAQGAASILDSRKKFC